MKPDTAQPDIDSPDQQLAAVIAQCFRAIGMGEPMASFAVQLMVEALRQHIGGSDLYIPAPDAARRNAEIRARFNGRNLDAVCKEFGVSKDTVYRAVKAVPTP